MFVNLFPQNIKYEYRYKENEMLVDNIKPRFVKPNLFFGYIQVMNFLTWKTTPQFYQPLDNTSITLWIHYF